MSDNDTHLRILDKMDGIVSPIHPTDAGQYPALVVDEHGRAIPEYPLYLMSAYDAIKMVYRKEAEAVSYYPDVFLRTGKMGGFKAHENPKYLGSPCFVAVPSIIHIKNPATSSRPYRFATYSRFGMFVRDRFKCLYCNSEHDLTIDHIFPKSRGGRFTWMNSALACFPCNLKKAARTPEEAGIRLRHNPFIPRSIELFDIMRNELDPDMTNLGRLVEKHPGWKDAIAAA